MKTIQKIISIFISIAFTPMAVAAINLVEITPKDIINYAESAAGSKYKLGYSQWDPDNREWGGVDCGGLVQKAWRWPTPLNYKTKMKDSYKVQGQTVPGKLFTGAMLEVKKHKLPWTMSSQLNTAQIGDSFTFYNGGETGHTLLVAGAINDDGKVKSLEARSSKYGVGYFERTISELEGKKYKLLRRNNVKGRSQTSPSPISSTTQSGNATYHTIKKGDTLWAISKQHKVSIGHILKLNPKVAKNPSVIQIGAKIRIK